MDELTGATDMSIRENPLDNPQDLVLNFHCKKPSFSLSQAINIMPYRRRLSIENLPFRGSSGIGRVESGETNVNRFPISATKKTKNSLNFGPRRTYSIDSFKPVKEILVCFPLVVPPALLDSEGIRSPVTTCKSESLCLKQIHQTQIDKTPDFGKLRSLFGTSSSHPVLLAMADRISSPLREKNSLNQSEPATPPLNETPRRHFIRNKRISPLGSLSIDFSTRLLESTEKSELASEPCLFLHNVPWSSKLKEFKTQASGKKMAP